MGDFNLSCRFCLKEDLPETTSFSLLDDKNANKILEMENLLFLKTSLVDLSFHPYHVCSQCVDIFENFLTLKTLCLESESFLLEHQEDIKEHGLALVKNSNKIFNIKEEVDKDNLFNDEDAHFSNFTIKDSCDYEDDTIEDNKGGDINDKDNSNFTKNANEFDVKEFKKGKQYNCPKCCYITKGKYNIERHVKRVHRQNRPFSCQFCWKTFVNNTALGKHMKRNHDICKEACQICGKRFRSDKLPEHTKTCAEDPKMRYKMVLQNESSLSTEELKREKRKLFLEAMGLGPLTKNGSLRINSVLTEPIPIAETTKDNLLRHKTEMSAKIPCEVCGAFTRRDWMKRHLRNLHGIGDKKTQVHVYPKLQCPKCPKKISVHGLAKHMRTVHSLRGALDMLVGCHMCGEEVQCSHMDYHVRNICLLRKAEKLEKESRPTAADTEMKKEESL